MHNILDLQARSRRQIKKPALMCLESPEKLRKIAASPLHGDYCTPISLRLTSTQAFLSGHTQWVIGQNVLVEGLVPGVVVGGLCGAGRARR